MRLLTGLTLERAAKMTAEEHRMFNNLKKSYADSDRIYSERPEDSFRDLCIAVDVAKNLHDSLFGHPLTHAGNKAKYIEFLNCAFPTPADGGLEVNLINFETKKTEKYSLQELIYHIRCMMVHENENLNAAEGTKYHVLLRWDIPANDFGTIYADCLLINGHLLRTMMREKLTGFITLLDSYAEFETTGILRASIDAPLGSIQPNRSPTRDYKASLQRSEDFSGSRPPSG